jgi:hypothetical protein
MVANRDHIYPFVHPSPRHRPTDETGACTSSMHGPGDPNLQCTLIVMSCLSVPYVLLIPSIFILTGVPFPAFLSLFRWTFVSLVGLGLKIHFQLLAEVSGALKRVQHGGPFLTALVRVPFPARLKLPVNIISARCGSLRHICRQHVRDRHLRNPRSRTTPPKLGQTLLSPSVLWENALRALPGLRGS